ncbi:MAG: polyhydroxyalkanoate synthesis repressor PhaR [Gammaproteobacteria bacterium]
MTAAAPEPYLVKRYSSRRLYDVAAGHFVTLAELDRVIRGGRDIRVVDSKGKDITRSVLLQILTEREASGEPLLSVEVLHEMVRLYGNVMQGPFGRYLQDGMALLQKQRETWQKALPNAFRGAASSAMERLVNQQMNLWKQSQQSFLEAFGQQAPQTKKPASRKRGAGTKGD